MMKVFISSAIEHERLPFANPHGIVLGRAHYSWKIIARMYHEALGRMHLQVTPIVAPDIYQSSVARGLAHIEPDDIHISVKPIEHIRPMFGVRNFFVCGWEFPEYSDTAVDGNPMNNHVAVLKRADQVICWSSFSADSLKKHGVTSAVRLPPPVADLTDLTAVPVDGMQCLWFSKTAAHNIGYSTLGAVRNDFDHVFLMVLNPWDARKNLPALVNAFTDYREGPGKGHRSALVIKLVIDNVGTQTKNIFAILEGHYRVKSIHPNIFFLGEHVSAQQMMGMYKLFDFYVCSSSAEGLNLPLIESMLVGMVPISSAATAMVDYITPQNAIVLPTSRDTARPEFSALAGGRKLTHFPPKFKELGASFVKAVQMTPAARKAKAVKARSIVMDRYGLDRFATEFKTLAKIR